MNLSICIIGRNAERDIARCLASVLPVADEIIYVDTGSSDRTVAIARMFTDKISSFIWNDDFSAARNFSLDQASGRWIMFMDTDDELTSESYDQINQLKNDPADCYFSFKINNVEPAFMEWVKLKDFGQIRMFPRKDSIRFEKALHEDLRPSLEKLDLTFFHFGDVVINHYGYMDKAVLKAKIKRDIRIKLVELGAANNAKILGFDLDKYMCFYYPNVLSIWEAPRCVCMVEVKVPESGDLLSSLIEAAEKEITKINIENSNVRLLEEINRITEATSKIL